MEKWELDILKERRDTEYWIDVEGNVHKWKFSLRELDDYVSTHFAIAKTLYPQSDYPEDILYNLNWIAIGSAAYGKRIKYEPTQAQINTMFDLGIKSIRDSYGKLYKF
jgi:hypothetical protein